MKLTPYTSCLEEKTLQPDAALRYITRISTKLITVHFKSNLSYYKCLQLFPVQQSGNLSIVLIFDLSLLLLLLQESTVSSAL